MSEQQDIVVPSESASNVSKKKPRPGKSQRNAARTGTPSVASAQTAPSSISNAMQFARKASYDPVPQPGKYPIVFQTGAGEPSRDSFMAIDGISLNDCLGDIGPCFSQSDKFAEFSADAKYDDDDFNRDVVVSGILSIAQQIVHSHLNMGLPLGDFSSVSTTEVYTMSTIKAICQQFGEFSEPYLGTRYLYKDYASEVKALVRTANRVKASNGEKDSVERILKEHWLPVKLDDKRTAFILANKINEYYAEYGITFQIEDLTSAIFNVEPPGYAAAKQALPANDRDVFDALFTGYTNAADFRGKFPNGNTKTLDALGLSWVNPADRHLGFNVVPKTTFPELAEDWLRKKPTISKFFFTATGLTDKSEARGTAAQLTTCSHQSGVTIVESRVALSAPQFSLVSCFSPTCFSDNVDEKRVVLTTSLSVTARAIEFLQKDWKG